MTAQVEDGEKAELAAAEAAPEGAASDDAKSADVAVDEDEIDQLIGATSSAPESSVSHGLAQDPATALSSSPQAAINASFGSSNGSGAAVAPTPAAPIPAYKANFTLADLHEALEVIRQLDPPGVGCRDLRECLLRQLRYHQAQLSNHKNADRPANGTAQVLQGRAYRCRVRQVSAP